MTADQPKRPRPIAATARIDKPPKPTKQQKRKQRREIEAWRKKSREGHQ